MDAGSQELNNVIINTEAAREEQNSMPQVLPVTKIKGRFYLRFIMPLLAFVIPVLLMGSISVSAINSYVDTLTLNASTEKTSGVSDIIKSEEERLKEEREAKSFGNVLKNHIYGSATFNTGIVRGLIDDMEDALSSSKGEGNLSYSFQEHFDPFYPLNISIARNDSELNAFSDNAPLYEKLETKTFKLILTEYLIRFGLASLTMFCFAVYCMKLNDSKALLISLMYSLSSLVIVFAQNSSIMNLVIVLPLVMWAVFKYQYKPSINLGMVLAIAIAGLAVTGIYGVVFGIPFVMIFMLYTGIIMQKSLSDNIRVTSLGLLSVISGLLLSFPVWMSYLQKLKPTKSIAEAFKSSSMRYTFPDFLYRFLPLSRLNLTYDASSTAIPEGTLSISKIYESGSLGSAALDTNLTFVPSMYMSVLALLLLICFFINKRIPVTGRICAGVLVFAYNFGYAFVPFDAISNIFDMGTVLGSVRFVFLHALLCFLLIVALGLFEPDNSSIKLATILLVCISIMFTALFDGDASSSLKPVLCVILPVVYYLIFTSFGSRKWMFSALAIILACEFWLVTDINFKTSVVPSVYCNNPLSINKADSSLDSSGVDDIMLLGKGNNNSFATVAYSDFEPKNILEVANLIYSEKYDSTLFEEMVPVTMYTECMDRIDGICTINDSDYGKLIATFDGKNIDENSRIILYSDYYEKSHWMITNIDSRGFLERGSSERGPFVRDITDEIDDIVNLIKEYGLQIEVDLMNNEGVNSFSLGFYIVDKNKIEEYNQLFSDGTASFSDSAMIRVITNSDFDSDLRVSINLRGYDTYDFCGKIAFDVDSAELTGKTVRISDSGGVQVVTVILEGCAWIIVLALVVCTRRRGIVDSKEEEMKFQNA